VDSHAIPLASGVVVPLARTDRGRLLEDLAQLHSLGVGQVRLTLDWARLQPRAGEWNGDESERVLGVLQHARSLGLAVHLTLLERTVPAWFDNDGGFTDARFALHWWPRWVEQCADVFGDALAATGGGWVPFDNPLGLANRLIPDDPRRHGELLDTLVVGWRDAWRVLRGAAPVITALGVLTVRPTDQTIPAAEAARRQDHLRWRLWLQALRDGTISIPGRADRQLTDLDGACDVVGIVVPHPDEALGAVHRAAEMGPDRPLHITLVTAPGPDRDRVTAITRYRTAVGEAADGTPLVAAHVTPTFDVDGRDDGIITRDRDVKDSAVEFTAPR
jgi:hypothetical protein